MHNHRREGLSILSIIIVFIIAITFSCDQKESNNNSSDIGHFDPKGKAPSEFTIAKWEELKNTMPFEDKRDFEEQKKPRIAMKIVIDTNVLISGILKPAGLPGRIFDFLRNGVLQPVVNGLLKVSYFRS